MTTVKRYYDLKGNPTTRDADSRIVITTKELMISVEVVESNASLVSFDSYHLDVKSYDKIIPRIVRIASSRVMDENNSNLPVGRVIFFAVDGEKLGTMRETDVVESNKTRAISIKRLEESGEVEFTYYSRKTSVDCKPFSVIAKGRYTVLDDDLIKTVVKDIAALISSILKS